MSIGKIMNYKIFILSCCLLVLGICAVNAETKADREVWRHELRIGWGDQLFESLVWHNPTTIAKTLPESLSQTYHEDYRYNQHLWLEYQYRQNGWFSYGFMTDVSEVSWVDVTRNGRGDELSRSDRNYFYNIVLMPTIRFTYFHHENVNIFTGLGLGLGINGGTELNSKGKSTDVGMAVQISVIGVSANYKRWFWTLDFGGLYSIKNQNTVFLASSRIISVGLGVRF